MFPMLFSSVNRSMISLILPHTVEKFAEVSSLHHMKLLKTERQADRSLNYYFLRMPTRSMPSRVSRKL
jgi:hypothetical protein